MVLAIARLCCYDFTKVILEFVPQGILFDLRLLNYAIKTEINFLCDFYLRVLLINI